MWIFGIESKGKPFLPHPTMVTQKPGQSRRRLGEDAPDHHIALSNKSPVLATKTVINSCYPSYISEEGASLVFRGHAIYPLGDACDSEIEFVLKGKETRVLAVVEEGLIECATPTFALPEGEISSEIEVTAYFDARARCAAQVRPIVFRAISPEVFGIIDPPTGPLRGGTTAMIRAEDAPSLPFDCVAVQIGKTTAKATWDAERKVLEFLTPEQTTGGLLPVLVAFDGCNYIETGNCFNYSEVEVDCCEPRCFSLEGGPCEITVRNMVFNHHGVQLGIGDDKIMATYESKSLRQIKIKERKKKEKVTELTWPLV
eukprot:TRINITY_DN127_c0_g1_i1.p1 TRINITY_DN127_c0_g1~~TRINITY_DN127_c0_g1_i1.p1  ORF type:complete len:314 (+),score=47.82 TRINITY_DN127_c0_g1_i1:281-1222(+)